MRCPTCDKETKVEGNPYRPFCSERCKMIDLDNWLSGRYRIPGPASNRDTESEDQRAPGGPEAEID